MASSPAPSTPDNTPRRMAMNRSFTLPPNLSAASKSSNQPPEIGSAKDVETLFIHPNASIVKFTTSASRPSSSSPGRPQSSSSAGTLPWATPTERTQAAGPMEIYRVPGSVSFLHSGSLLHAIMARSQCWCVDGVSKFALRVLPDTYYRIELPGGTDEDLENVEKLKLTLQKVCFYERTPCPFARTFTVDLPEEAASVSEVKKKKRRSTTGPAKKWKLDQGYSWRPEGWVPPKPGEAGSEEEEDASASASGSMAESEDDEDEQDTTPGAQERQIAREKVPAAVAEAEERADRLKELPVSTPLRSSRAQRSVTAPVKIDMQPSTSQLTTRVDVDRTVEVTERLSESSISQDASMLRTFQAIPTDMPPSPPDSSAGLEYPESRTRTDDVSQDGASAVQDKMASVPNRVNDINSASEVDQEKEPSQNANTADEQGLQVTDRTVDPLQDQQDEPVGNTQPIDDTTEIAKEAEVEPNEESQEVAVTNDQQHLLDPVDAPSTSETFQQDIKNDDEAEEEEQPQQSEDDNADDRPSTPPNRTPSHTEDPYAAIQARILARRSIGGTTAFHPLQKSPTTSSTTSTATTKSSLSRRSRNKHQHDALAYSMAKKAYSVFLGPPAHLVAIMLQIAARFANGTFGVNGVLHVESPKDERGKVPGSYHLAVDDGSGIDWEDDEDEELEEEDEDDFGVPLKSPSRLRSQASRDEIVANLRRRASDGASGWSVD